ncbi:MAG TPA: heme-binding domain-containing protein [Anaerolineales bacterium]|nr:heme-binding domain-containing protein [Anaerolineales bacterium]
MKKVFLIVLGLIVLIQLLPYGRSHNNPPVVQEPAWQGVETRPLAQRACFDCHSNETEWAWYSNIAPASWLIQHDVEEGRSKLNFSEWGRGEQETGEIGEVILNGEMPPAQYTLIHPDSRLSTTENEMLLNGFSAMGIAGAEEREKGD